MSAKSFGERLAVLENENKHTTDLLKELIETTKLHNDAATERHAALEKRIQSFERLVWAAKYIRWGLAAVALGIYQFRDSLSALLKRLI